MKSERTGINPHVPPTGEGCVECLASGGWWLHLRRCAECGHIGCCDSSPSQHASKHFQATGHPIAASFEPGETWFYDYRTRRMTPAKGWRSRGGIRKISLRPDRQARYRTTARPICTETRRDLRRKPIFWLECEVF